LLAFHDDATLDERSFGMGSVPLRNRWFADSQLEGGVRCELVSEFLESIKRGPKRLKSGQTIDIYTILMFFPERKTNS
jgi:hypothetical protein